MSHTSSSETEPLGAAGPTVSGTPPARVLRPPLSDGRAYVFASDLFDSLVASTGAAGPATLRLTRLTDHAIELRHDVPQPQAEGFCGWFTYRRDGATVGAWLRLRAGEVVQDRLPLMDLDLVEEAVFSADGAFMPMPSAASVAKAALVLAVSLLEQLFPDDVWNLAEMDATAGPCAGETVSVRIERQLGRFLIVSAWVDAARWGQFILAATPFE